LDVGVSLLKVCLEKLLLGNLIPTYEKVEPITHPL